VAAGAGLGGRPLLPPPPRALGGAPAAAPPPAAAPASAKGVWSRRARRAPSLGCLIGALGAVVLVAAVAAAIATLATAAARRARHRTPLHAPWTPGALLPKRGGAPGPPRPDAPPAQLLPPPAATWEARLFADAPLPPPPPGSADPPPPPGPPLRGTVSERSIPSGPGGGLLFVRVDQTGAGCGAGCGVRRCGKGGPQ
jgi:hypothetical protein